VRSTLVEILTLFINSPQFLTFLLGIFLLLVVIILLVVFRKKIQHWVQQGLKKNGEAFRLSYEKKQIHSITASGQNRRDSNGVRLEEIDMDSSDIGDIEGNVELKKVKMKKSTINSIRSK